ncbi:MAG: polyphosphate--glucose phosphotransferase [Propionibacteriaceae bacterium]
MGKHAVLGIDIGGSGIKGAPVALATGDFSADRLRIPTPTKSSPKNVAAVVKEIVEHFASDIDTTVPIGITVPAPVVRGKVPRIANLDKAWEGLDVNTFFSEKLGRPVFLYNDADAAGIAEVHYGAAKDIDGLIIVTTLGTGIGTALIHNGILIPNSELGHLELDGKDAETVAAASIREKEELSYKQWAPRLQRYYSYLEGLFYPDLFVVGGGVSKNSDKYLPLLDLKTPIVPATLQNRAGIIGAARLAADSQK